MKRLLIVGAGGFGREILCWARDIQVVQKGWSIGGFLDANPAALDPFNLPAGIIGDPASFQPSNEDILACALGDPATRRSVIAGLQARGAQFATLIHPTCVIGADCRIGTGCVLCPGAVLTTNVTLGRFVTVNLGATVGHDASVGDWCNLNVHVDLAGHASLGESVFTGSHAFVLPGVTVGDHAIVGAGAVVTRNVAAGCTVFGVPARQIISRPALAAEDAQ